MNILVELGVILTICLAGEWIAAVLPFSFPASVASLVLLTLLLMTGVVKQRHIQTVSHFFLVNMGLFFVPTLVGTLEHMGLLAARLLPFLAVSLLTTPVVYLSTAWSVQLLTRSMRRKEEKHYD